mmetsp:Transcript_16755/g.40064  ORF Transcript_16755/g.40064 Transcript_16755/m.40064 type:complete len:89 (+) Transcript_16755:304-570(+)
MRSAALCRRHCDPTARSDEIRIDAGTAVSEDDAVYENEDTMMARLPTTPMRLDSVCLWICWLMRLMRHCILHKAYYDSGWMDALSLGF